MGWVGTILIISCEMLTSIMTLTLTVSHKSFHAIKLFNKDSYV